jgi:hypothetical protein
LPIATKLYTRHGWTLVGVDGILLAGLRSDPRLRAGPTSACDSFRQLIEPQKGVLAGPAWGLLPLADWQVSGRDDVEHQVA